MTIITLTVSHFEERASPVEPVVFLHVVHRLQNLLRGAGASGHRRRRHEPVVLGGVLVYIDLQCA